MSKKQEVDISKLINAMPEIIASMIPIAKSYKAKYDALVIAGFTEDQALQIVMARGLNDMPREGWL